MFQLVRPSAEYLSQLVSKRAGEQKLGENISIDNASAKFGILGIAEDIGVRLNGGIAGAATAYPVFLKAFCNIQQNQFFSGADFKIAGTIEMLAGTQPSAMSMQALDEIVAKHVLEMLRAGLIPIVVGGGHNNVLPMLKALAHMHDTKINVVNLDPHADLRADAERHSGNGFSFARANNYLHKYAMLGLHQAYNNQYIWDLIAKDQNLNAVLWEDIFLSNRISWADAIEQSLSFVQGKPFGVELDIDAIQNALSSAATPVGVLPSAAMQYLYQAALLPNASYLHLPEGIAARADGECQPSMGKLLSYLVQAFVAGVNDRPKN